MPSPTRRKKPQKEQITYQAELLRKTIHLCSIGIPIGAWFVTRAEAVLILAVMLAFSILIDQERTRRGPIGDILRGIFGTLLRPHEQGSVRKNTLILSGASWMLISAVITFGLFPKPVAVAAFLMLILCDTAAALVGRRFGSIRFGPRKKSIEGSLAFFGTGILIALCTPQLPLLVGAMGALAAAVAEALPWEVDDNFSVPLGASLMMVIVMAAL